MAVSPSVSFNIIGLLVLSACTPGIRIVEANEDDNVDTLEKKPLPKGHALYGFGTVRLDPRLGKRKLQYVKKENLYGNKCPCFTYKQQKEEELLQEEPVENKGYIYKLPELTSYENTIC